MMLGLYRALTVVASPAVRVLLASRARAGREDSARIDERYGVAALPRPEGALVWVHAASVGESISALPLIEKILSMRGDLHVLVTTGTVTSAALMAERLPNRAFHQYAPVDLPDVVRRFLDHWRPDLALWVESEFWPNLILESQSRGIPLLLVNARVSDRAFARWRRAKGMIARMLKAFAMCLAQSDRDAARLEALGAADVRSLGNLKFAAPPLPADEAEHSALALVMGIRPRWLAASTHPGEEEIIAGVHRALAPRFPGLLTVVAPRHPARAPEIASLFERNGLAVATRSQGRIPAAGIDIYLADTMGELGLFFRLCPIAFVGGSLVPHGGHNILEPAALSCAVLHGTHMDNFRFITQEMIACGASTEVKGEDSLAREVERLLRDPSLVEAYGGRAAAAASSKRAVLDAVASAISPFLDAIAKAGRG